MKVTFTVDAEQWNTFVYNLTLVAPGKGEAKKTVSRGFIRLYMYDNCDGTGELIGMATDDILSVITQVTIGGPTTGSFQPALWVTVDALKSAGELEGVLHLEVSEDFDEKFDKLFWAEHVYESIAGAVARNPDRWSGVSISPDRLRKFSLLKPQGNPIHWEFVEWADRSIIRWRLGDNLRGVYVPVD